LAVAVDFRGEAALVALRFLIFTRWFAPIKNGAAF
jgi:hypothetical protein